MIFFFFLDLAVETYQWQGKNKTKQTNFTLTRTVLVLKWIDFVNIPNTQRHFLTNMTLCVESWLRNRNENTSVQPRLECKVPIYSFWNSYSYLHLSWFVLFLLLICFVLCCCFFVSMLKYIVSFWLSFYTRHSSIKHWHRTLMG